MFNAKIFLQVLSSAVASSAIATLSPGGVLMQPVAPQAINRKYAAQIKLRYMTLLLTRLKEWGAMQSMFTFLWSLSENVVKEKYLFLLNCLSMLFVFSEMVPTEIQGELKHLYFAAEELLRHFWSCFPVNTTFLEEKVTSVQKSILRKIINF